MRPGWTVVRWRVLRCGLPTVTRGTAALPPFCTDGCSATVASPQPLVAANRTMAKTERMRFMRALRLRRRNEDSPGLPDRATRSEHEHCRARVRTCWAG